jgi:hypothetical protein
VDNGSVRYRRRLTCNRSVLYRRRLTCNCSILYHRRLTCNALHIINNVPLSICSFLTLQLGDQILQQNGDCMYCYSD